MRTISGTVKALVLLLVFPSLLGAADAPAPSAASPTFDHLTCFPVKDSLTPKPPSYLADLLAAQSAFIGKGCEIAMPAKAFCVYTEKANVQPAPPFQVPGQEQRDFLCYSITNCKTAQLPVVTVQDQFGKRRIEPMPPNVLCAPANKQ